MLFKPENASMKKNIIGNNCNAAGVDDEIADSS